MKVRRRHPVKKILDFYCYDFLLGIEVDGSVHDNDEAKEYDQKIRNNVDQLKKIVNASKWHKTSYNKIAGPIKAV